MYKPFYDKNITKPGKKYSVYVKNNRLIHFGDTNYQHYKDKIGRYKYLDHGDKERRKRYLSRAKKIKNKKGRFTYKDKNSPNYYAVKYLW